MLNPILLWTASRARAGSRRQHAKAACARGNDTHFPSGALSSGPCSTMPNSPGVPVDVEVEGEWVGGGGVISGSRETVSRVLNTIHKNIVNPPTVQEYAHIFIVLWFFINCIRISSSANLSNRSIFVCRSRSSFLGRPNISL